MDSHHETLLEYVTTSHPGETVLEYLDFHEWSQRELARRTGLTPKTISEICNGKASITPNTALALEKVFRRPAHFWLNLQMTFSEATARNRQLSSATDWSQWAKRFPLREMRRLKFSLPSGHSEADVLLRFFRGFLTRQLEICLGLRPGHLQANADTARQRGDYRGVGP